MKKILLVTLTMLFLAFTAFASDPETFVNLTIGMPETLDPLHSYDTASGEAILNLYDNLIQYDGESVTEFLPMISTAVPSVENGLVVEEAGALKFIFPIREGVKFHTGNILTPEDVKYSFDRYILGDPSGGPQWMIIEALTGGKFASVEGWFEDYAGMPYSEAVDAEKNATSEEAKQKLISFYEEVVSPRVAVDGNNIVFTLDSAWGPFMSTIAHFGSWGAIVDSKWGIENGAWDGKADGWWKWHDLEPQESPYHAAAAGCGPFKLVEWDTAQQKVILERFDDYWAGPAKLKTVVIWGIDEFSTRKAIFEAGDADICYFGSSYLDQAEALAAEGKAVVTKGYPTASITSLHFNWLVAEGSEYLGSGKLDGNGVPRDFFSDIHVRRGFAFCYDGATFVDEVLNGNGVLVPSDLPQGFLGYDETLPLPEFNLAKAAEEFKKAWGGEVWEKGFKIQILYNTGNDERQTIAEMLAYFVNMINPKFKVETLGVQWPTYLAAQRNGFLPLFTIGWLADYPDPHNFIATYYASYGVYASRQGVPFQEWAAENVDANISKAAASVDNDERFALYRDVQEKAIEAALGIPLYMPTGLNVRAPWVEGWHPHLVRSGFYYYQLSKKQ
ncbi:MULTISPECIES: ABC transporter substrate-binding protein [unclassified Mesotoga]|uniref:ABC transporter substrate-binding protein n=1 Tax=unclassified Mesotoga TaxID=1184398 RepID=UPI001BD329DC|nr:MULTISPECIES: ABC transporter substrate-binding protein [unclassified Mesotoga]